MMRICKKCLFTLLVAMALPATTWSAELFVDASATAGGDGSTDRPFPTIAEALGAMAGGDIVTVREGVYRETLRMTKGGSDTQPSTLRAADGERVIVSGFTAISGWKKQSGGIYSTTVDGIVQNLYVGYSAQRIASSLDKPEAWADVVSSDQRAGKLVVGSSFAKLAGAAAITEDKADACAFVFFRRGNVYHIIPIRELDPQQGILTVDSKAIRGIGGNDRSQDRLILCNHRSLIDRPGEWACKTSDGKSTLYFMPISPDDLQQTQTVSQQRSLLSVGHWRDPQTDFRVEGIEFAGSQSTGLQVGRVARVTVTSCIFHNHRRSGAAVRRCSEVRIGNSIAFANQTGLSVASSQHVVVEQNEVFANYVDGIVVAGDVSGHDAEPETHDVTVRRNYVHHHLLLGHPDNFQTYRGVHNIRFQDNLAILAGQGLMTEQTDGGELTNNVFFGSGARLIIFGHQSSNDWHVINNTLGFGGWGGIGMDGKNYTIARNVILNNVLGRDRAYTGDHNLLWNPDPTAAILRVVKPRFRNFSDVAPYRELTGQDKHSRRTDPQLANVPAFQGTATDLDKCSAKRLELRGGDAGRQFAINDHIEINGDGVDRQVKEVGDSHICFSPPLPIRPWRITLVWNWRKRTNFALDFMPRVDSPAHTMGPNGQHVGARLDAAAYRAGDFDGDGHRDLPSLADDLKMGIPQSNNPVVLQNLPTVQ